MEQWWALMIGNSRFHWGEFRGTTLEMVQHTPHDTIPMGVSNLVYLASVVPPQTARIQAQFPTAQPLTLADIPLKNVYGQLGIDRALAVWGAGMRYGFPCLVIDGGTALTFSGVDGAQRWAGGAILPGLGLQFRSLASHTAALPQVTLPLQLPPRWANETPGAIASGITYTLLAGVKDFVQAWRQRFPHSPIITTGGDGAWLAAQLPPLTYDATLIFRGFSALKQQT
ncbi:pantothenate kinase [Synechococcus moorigangaii CMS01]|nr:pantothenate kinase [Synechococcus moorigangaii CMS01]